jgi:hypothetical protein
VNNPKEVRFQKKKIELTSGTQKSERNQEAGDGLARRQETNGFFLDLLLCANEVPGKVKEVRRISSCHGGLISRNKFTPA